MIVREVRGPDEAVLVEELQIVTWGRNEREVVPRGMLIATQMQGGLLAGAFEEGEMIGFVLGFPTSRSTVQHSHMLAVTPAARGRGVALALKRYQREWCLERGIDIVEWTFDPLRVVNAHFNLHRLGATVRRYLPHLYGEMSGINAGVDSDRVLASWNLVSEHVERAVRGERPRPGGLGVVINEDAPHGFDRATLGPRLLVRIPEDFGEIVREDREAARAWRRHGRDVLSHLFEEGYAITDFSREANAHVLTRV
ncbi:GNAT family N-acetyltransferase [Deinococcus yavapaiensis]|uniref:Putative GNAT superfamily acetyltransferase n=1 Tax=Deinococcus yavapaiensis KR-236 TaxID=694435 RepID=A0A318SHD8_9DEIO|nr:GNAT family N-acetyltransferase [Deinococcus yavapaiensis]PYE56545.1 putative GNAT superfamily acetyltransferase [Deinococcus yavapaiensis KR-236]